MPEVLPWSENLLQEFKTGVKDKERALFIEQHPDYPTYLIVSSFDPLFPHTLKDIVGEYRAVNKLQLQKLLDAADEKGYSPIVYTRDPKELFGFLESLDDPYPYELNFTFKHFQLRGFNFTKDLPSALINWSTGTGKSCYAVARTKYLLEDEKIDKVVVLSKAHNKINWQRQFLSKGNLRAEIDDECGGSLPATRRENRAEMYKDATIFIINYEKMGFRPENEVPVYSLTGRKKPSASGDGQELMAALKGKRVLWIWDEMPTKMKGMQTRWYKGAQKLLSKTKKNYQVELTARKINRDPENIYACTKILDKTIWPTKAGFRSTYSRSMSTFSPWQVAVWDQDKLPELGMRISHITHIADKYTDPEIRAEFPEDHWEDIDIDMSPADRKLYDLIREAVIEDSQGNNFGIMNRLAPLQLLCNNPLTLNQSESAIAKRIAADHNLTDFNCSKLDTLNMMLDEIEGKVVIFSMYNTLGAHMLAPYMAKWGHTFVLYDGTKKQMQQAQDKFREDKRIKIFLSSDQGSDSIDLEQATTVINYDLPWNDSTLDNRVNRISRLTSEADHVFFYNLIMANTMEEKKLKLLLRKRKMEEAVNQPLKEQSDLLHSDLEYLLDF